MLPALLLVLWSGHLFGQGVFERGTFVTLPAGKHVNHVFQGAWNAYFAVEDGVLVYDHHNEKWLEPITASNGLIQYPALIVWQDPISMEVWIVTPDYLFIYDHTTGWMQKAFLPRDEAFTGVYSLGVTPDRVLVTASGTGAGSSYSAVFLRNSGTFEFWESDSSLDINWESVLRYDPEELDEQRIGSLLTDIVAAGGFDADGALRLDGYPQNMGAEVSAYSSLPSGESFIGTQGLGVFYRPLQGAAWVQKPFGLLSPDVMSLKMSGNQLLVGGRAGLTILEGFDPHYDEAIADPSYDYSFISAISYSQNLIFIAGREGVFARTWKGKNWDRLVSKDDLKSKRIYTLAAGSSGNLMIGTDQNAFLYTKNGVLLNSIFPKNADWSVYHITYTKGVYYLATVFGLYVYDETLQAFTGRINSQGELQPPQASAAIDPIYHVQLSDTLLWATTSRGLIVVNPAQGTGESYLSPNTPFKPRGLIVHGSRVWVGSESGLISYDPKSLAWRLYTREDGLISNFITDLAGSGEYIWVGSNLGLTRVLWRNLY